MRTGNRPKRDKQKEKTSKPLKRKIHLSSGVWSYDINRNGVRIRTPSGDDTHHISYFKFMGWSPDSEGGAEILPSDIVGYIRRMFLKTDPDWKYQYYHKNARFADKHGIDMLKTTTRELEAMIKAQDVQDRKEKEKRERHRIHLAMENLDLLLQLTDHQLTSCSDDEPFPQGRVPEFGGRRIECIRCFLLHCQKKGKWDPNFKLYLGALRSER